jgi:hypothetical protein
LSSGDSDFRTVSNYIKMKLTFLFLFFTQLLFAQEHGRISGVLMNDSCAVIQNAYLTISDVRGGLAREEIISTKTDQNGAFSITELPVGIYSISIDLRDKVFGGVNYSDAMTFKFRIEADKDLHLSELVFEPNLICMCDFEIVPYVKPRDPFGRSITFTRDDLRMR